MANKIHGEEQANALSFGFFISPKLKHESLRLK